MLTSKNFNSRFEIIRTLAAILISLGIGLVIILLISKDPLNAISTFVFGPLGSTRKFFNVIELAIPLTFCGLAMSMMFTANQTNVSVEGAFFLSCAVTSFFAIVLDLPLIIHPIICLITGTITGILVTSIPATLKLFYNADELVSSLMLNYICLNIANYIIRMTVLDTSLGITTSKPFQKNANLPRIIPQSRIHVGLIFVIICVILCWILITKSKLGYEIRISGHNRFFAKYAGINVNKSVLMAQLIGGALAGFGGATEMLGMYTRFQYQGLTQYGFDGMIIAIIAKNKPSVVPFAALFLAYIRIGADIMNRNSDIPLEMISVIQSIIIMLVVASMFLSKFRQKFLVKLSAEAEN